MLLTSPVSFPSGTQDPWTRSGAPPSVSDVLEGLELWEGVGSGNPTLKGTVGFLGGEDTLHLTPPTCPQRGWNVASVNTMQRVLGKVETELSERVMPDT